MMPVGPSRSAARRVSTILAVMFTCLAGAEGVVAASVPNTALAHAALAAFALAAAVGFWLITVLLRP